MVDAVAGCVDVRAAWMSWMPRRAPTERSTDAVRIGGDSVAARRVQPRFALKLRRWAGNAEALFAGEDLLVDDLVGGGDAGGAFELEFLALLGADGDERAAVGLGLVLP